MKKLKEILKAKYPWLENNDCASKLVYKPPETDTKDLKPIPMQPKPLREDFDGILSPEWIVNLKVDVTNTNK